MGRVDRRALFTSGAAAALLAATGVSLEAAPRTGGSLRLAVARDGSFADVVRCAVADCLTEIGPDGALKPELASAWISDAAAKRWEWQLKEAVQFHDGQALQADAVRDSLVAQGLGDRVRLQGMEAVTAHRLVIELAEAQPDLPLILADPRFAIRRSGPEGQQIGTGLFRQTRLQDDRHFLGQKVDGHYKSGEAGWVDRFEVIVIPDPMVRAEALRDGYVDVAALPDADGLRGGYQLWPSETDIQLAAHRGVGLPGRIGTTRALDDGRIAERWWMQ